MKVKIFKTVKIIEIACLAVLYALATVFLYRYLFASEELKELGILIFFVFGLLLVILLTCFSCVVLSGISVWLIAKSRVGRVELGGFMLAAIVKFVACIYFLSVVVIEIRSGDFLSLLWALPSMLLVFTMALTDLLMPKKLFM